MAEKLGNSLDIIQQQIKKVQEKLARLKQDMSDKAKGEKAKLGLSIANLEKQKDDILFNTKRETRNKLSLDEEKKFDSITNKEFLKFSREQRLKYITIGNIDYKDVQEWKDDKIQFSFTFNSKFNGRLYLKTTAWQVLPPNIKIVESWWEKWERNGFYGEFFNKSWQRLIIHEWTKINIKERIEQKKVDWFFTDSLQKAEKFQWANKNIALYSLQRWLAPELAIALFSSHLDLSKLSEADKKVEIEYMITEFERAKDYFLDTFPQGSVLKEWKLSKEFLSFFLNYFETNKTKRGDIFRKIGFTDEEITKFKSFSREEVVKVRWLKQMEEISAEDLQEIKPDILNKFKKESIWDQFVPRSKEAQQLFTYATIMAWLPKEWGENEALHTLLEKESGWIVGNLNYEFFKRGRKETTKEFKEKVTTWEFANTRAVEVSWDMGIKSNCSWLGQLRLDNIEVNYPNGREWIGIPLDEAVGMLRYIRQRHKTPEQALAFHLSHNWY